MFLDKFFDAIFGEKFDEEAVLKACDEHIKETAQKLVDEYLDSLIPEITFEKLSEDATIPTYADDDAEGMDLYSPVNITIPARGQANIKLGIKADIPKTHWLMFASRSGAAWKAGIEKGAGIIDRNYNKELGLILYNLSDTPYMIIKGDRIAQAIPMLHNRLRIKEGIVEDSGRGGFGSTGK